MANEFDDVLDQESAGTLAPLRSGLEKTEFDDALDADVSQQQNYVRTVIDIATKDNPDAAAERVRLSKTTGLPPDVVARNQQELKRREIARAIDLQRMMRDSPVLYRQMTDPTFTGAAIDDLDTLRQIEKTFGNIANYAKSGEMASDAGGAAKSLALGATVGVGKMIFDLFGAATDLVGLDYLSRGYRTMSEDARQAMDAFGMQVNTSTGQAIKSGLESAGQNIALLPIGLERGLFQTAEAAGAAVAGAMSVGVGADSYMRARGQGSDRLTSSLYGLSDAGVEYIFEQIPAAKLFKGIELDQSLLKQLGTQFVSEGWTEQVTTVAQDFNEWMLLNPQKSTAEFLAERPEAAYQTLIATLVGTGVQTGAIAGIDKIVTRATDKALSFEHDRFMRQMALAGNVELRERSPEQFRDYVSRAMSQQEGPQEVYVDAEVLNQLPQDLLNQLPEEVRAQIPDALSANSSIAIPMADVLTIAPGTELQQILNDHARIGNPEAPSRIEAQQADQFIREESDRVLQQASDRDAWEQSVATVRQTVLDDLNTSARFAPEVNERYADLQAAFFSTMASRTGTTPEELYQRFALNVRAQGQAAQGEVLNAGAQIDTPQFREWFGDSKVVDAEGRPLVVYHYGTFGEGDNFVPNGPMHFGTEQSAYDRSVSKRKDDAAMAVTTYQTEDGIWHWEQEDGVTSEEIGRKGFSSQEDALDYGRAQALEWVDQDPDFDPANYGNMTAVFLNITNPKRVVDAGGMNGEWDGVIQQAKAEGHDGIVYNNRFEDKGSDSYIAFNPTQIKSATGNTGAFDPANPNVLRQLQNVLSGKEKVPTFSRLDEVVAWIADRAKTDRVVSPDLDLMSSRGRAEAVDQIAKHTLLELKAWGKLKGDYRSFYGEDIEKHTNPLITQYVLEKYGRKPTQDEIALIHLASAFGSGQSTPTVDTQHGLTVFDEWMRTGKVTGYSDKPKPIYKAFNRGENPQRVYIDSVTGEDTPIATGNEPKFDAEKKAQISKTYNVTGLARFMEIHNALGGNLHKTITWLGNKHSFTEIERVIGQEAAKKLKPHEYLDKNGQSFGVFALGNNPKLGSYILNRWGHFGTITKDMWVARTMSRYFDEPNTGEPWDLTKVDLNKRKILEEAWNIVAKRLKVKPAEIQEMMWDAEKKIYARFGQTSEGAYTSSGVELALSRLRNQQSRDGAADPASAGTSSEVLEQSAFHGTPYRGIDKFSTDKIGTGEGAQAYGWGLYFASKREIAEFYREKLGASAFTYDGQSVSNDGSPRRAAVELLWSWQGDKAGALDDAESYDNAAAIKREIRALDGDKIQRGGQLYEVEIPEDSEMLLWDTPVPDDVLQRVAEMSVQRGLLDGDVQDALEMLEGEADRSGRLLYTGLSEQLGGDKQASEFLASIGIKGIKYLDGSSRTAGDGSYNYVVFSGDDVAIKNQFYQSQSTSPLGTFNPETLLLTLNENANLSTFLHESGHFFLEVMADLASQPGAPQQVVDDMTTFLKWTGVPDLARWNGYTLNEKRAHHERFAESFEQYLLEGKAPSTELQSLFRTFRSWLLRVYTSLQNFMRGRDLKVNDEIRQVFDRMLATDEEIRRAEEQAGLLPDFNATNEAIEKLQAQSLRNLKWTLNARSKFLKQFTAEARELRKGILAEVLAAFEQRPDAMASRAIRKVRNKAGAERDAKIAAIADATGYATVEEMTAAVEALGPVNEAVEAEVDRLMLERHGDMATPEALEAAANEAVHNEARARSLAAELRAQNDAMNPRETTGRTDARGRPITVNALLQAARTFGANLASRRQVKQLKNTIYLHRAAEARAGKAWQKATAAGDTKAAVQAKKDQLLNNQAVRALLDAQAEVQAAITFFRKVTKGNNEKLVKGGRDPDVVNAMRAILGVYGIAPRTGQGAMEYMEIVQQNDPETAKALMPAVINAISRNKPYTELTVEELRGLRDDLKSMWHLAKESRQIEVDGVRMSIEDAREKLYGRLEAKGIPDKVPGQTSARTAGDKAAGNLRELGGNLTRVEQWTEAMDGRIGGPFNTILFRAIKVAADNYRAARAPVFKRLEEATQAVKPFIARTPISAPRLNYVFGLGDGHNNTGMAELLAALLNTGNESNKRKLLLGGRPGNPWASENPDGTLNTSEWDATIADLVAKGTLRKEHFDYVQAVWDVLESLKPLAQESHRRVFGRYFNEVTAQPFVDPFGVTRSGGYYPAKVDPALVPDGQLRELARQENESLEFSFPAAPSGWSKNRVENYTKPLLLDMNLMFRHIDEVLLFSHMQPSVNAVNRLLRDRKLVSALSRVAPEAYGSILTPWLAGAARQIVEEQVPSDGGFNRAASIIRSRTGLQLMMANASNTIQQVTGAFSAAGKLEADGMERSALIKAAAKWASNPKAFRDNVWNLSIYMRDRSESETSSLLDTMRDIMFNPTLKESAQKWSRQHGYFSQVFFDNTFSPIVWSAGYSAYLNKLPKVDTRSMSATEVQALLARQNREAILYADGLVRQTQGSNLPEDVSRFERGTGFTRLFNQFAGWANMQLNTNVASIVKLAEEGGLKKNTARGFYVLMMGLLMPIWVAEAIAIAFRGGPGDDDDDGAMWDDWLKAIFGLGTFKGLVAMAPVIGQIASYTVNRVATKSPADDRISVSPVLNVLESAVGGNVYTGYQLATGEEVNAQRAVKDLAMLIGLATGVPAYAVARPLGYAAGVAQGKIEPTGAMDAARGVITGTASPESRNP